jgi:replicative DNA helicase
MGEPEADVLADEWAERYLLGAMILSGSAAEVVAVPLDIFSFTQHRDIAEAIIHLVEQGIAVDYEEVRAELRRRGKNVSAATITNRANGLVLTRPLAARVAYLAELRDRRRLAKVGEDLQLSR